MLNTKKLSSQQMLSGWSTVWLKSSSNDHSKEVYVRCRVECVRRGDVELRVG